MRVLVTGASGPIGAALLPSLREKGMEVVRTSRRAEAPVAGERVIQWDPMQPVPPEAVNGMDAVVHLAGESIVGRWNDAKKNAIRESRVAGTTHLAQALAACAAKPRVFLCASAVGYYGDRGEEIMRESSPPGNGFLPDVCVAWEAATTPASDAGIRSGDVLTAIDERPISQFNLSDVRQMFKRETKYNLAFDRGGQRLKVVLKLRRMI